MKTVDEDIRTGNFKQIYLFYGEEGYLKKQYRDKLKAALAGSEGGPSMGEDMNFTAFEGKDINPKAVIDLAETLPFFAERRVILIENSGFFKSSCDDLADYLAQPAETTFFLFVEEEVDKRSRMYKAVKKAGKIVEFATQTEELLTRWILSRLKKEGKNITAPVMQLFLGKTGSDMGNIDRELEKLLCYTLEKDVIEAEDVEAVTTEQTTNKIFFLGKTGSDMGNIDRELEKLLCYTLEKDVIEAEDVEAVTTEQTTNKIFEMVNAIAEHNQRRALDLYYDLLTLKEPPMRIMYLISRQFQILLAIRDMAAKGIGQQMMAQKAGIPPFAVRRNLAQAKGFTVEQLKGALREGVDLEEAVKTGQMNDQMAVELFIMKYSAAKRQEESGRGR